MKPLPKFLAKLPTKATQLFKTNYRIGQNNRLTWDVVEREVVVSATDGHSVIARLSGCSRFVCPIADVKPLSHPAT